MNHMALTSFSPLNWACPHCARRHSPSSALMLYRGTCQHDLCCIPEIAIETRAEDTTTVEGRWATVSCPIDGCRGKFHACIDEKGAGEDTTTYLSSISKVKRERKCDDNKEVEVIDLCDDGSNDGSDAKYQTQPKRPRRAVKREKEAAPERLASVKLEKGEEGKPDEHISSIKMEKKNRVSPSASNEKIPLKLELKEETDDDSRFSEGEEQFVEPPQGKKMRRETASKANFWDQVADPVDFSRRAFMTKPLFHLNSGIDGKVKHQNLWFGPFLREGLATPGFAEVPPEIAQKVPNSTYEEIRDAINEETYDGQSMRSSCQVALWLVDATVGSFVVMRHEFPECPFTPSRLKSNGKYIGPVYVIGVVTQKILPGSAHEKRIKKKQMGEYKRHNTHTFSLVDWRWMGMKATLQEETKRYINSVCQPTINRMCQDPRKEYKCAATGEAYTGESVRHDLWENATIPIRSEEFPDVFDIEAIRHYDSD